MLTKLYSLRGVPSLATSQPPVVDIGDLSAEHLVQGPVIVFGMAEEGRPSVLWFENDLLLRRDVDGLEKARGLADAIKLSGLRSTTFRNGAKFIVFADSASTPQSR
jgi:hypothetical protein